MGRRRPFGAIAAWSVRHARAVLALAGAVAFAKLPVSPLPKVDYPTIQVSAGLPGASPETVASSLTTPLERALGAIAGVTELLLPTVCGER